MHIADPSGHSPEKVAEDPAYEVMNEYQRGNYWPSACEIVVKHKETSSYWRAVYAVGDDNSDWEFPCTWNQVFPEQVTITRYKTSKERGKT